MGYIETQYPLPPGTVHLINSNMGYIETIRVIVETEVVLD